MHKLVVYGNGVTNPPITKPSGKKQENKSRKNHLKEGRNLNKQLKAKEKKLQKTTEIVSRQSLAAQFFSRVADTKKQGDA